MHEHLPKRSKVAATFMAMLLVITLTAALLPKATATPIITFIDPESGHVGDVVRVAGEIDTVNGSYTLFFDGEEVKNGTAVGTAVNDTFIVPHRPLGNYSVMLHDATTKVNYTFPISFAIETAYYVKVVVPPPPQQLQEGESTQILVNVTGGEANTVYSANITVTDPSGTVYYNDTLQLTNTTNTGYGEGNITYPANFTSGAHTNYTGVYNIAFNETPASGNFTVGLTNAAEYYRFQVVGIRATGYKPSESVWVNITFAGEDVISIPKNASIGGVVEASWEIPGNASLGVYTVTVTNSTTPGTVKPVRDVQNFTVTGGIDPTSGPVGTTVRIVGQIDTQNGTYRILWDGESVKEGMCAPGSVLVNDTFVVPTSVKGNHNITLYDVTLGTESLPFSFEVTTSYRVSADPTRIQEGLDTTITLDMYGAEANTTYAFMINVTDPTSAHYNATLAVLTNATGSGSNSTSYYEDFSADANTNYVGTYTIAVVRDNEILATENFTVGLTDRLEYGITETGTRVSIRGAGYEYFEMVFVNITFAGVPVPGYPELTQAEADGSFIYYWRIPKDAKPGIYTVTLTNETGVHFKPVPDIQNFTVVEIVARCKTQNKYDGKPLADVTVKAYRDIDLIASGETNKNGTVDLRLDFGNYTFKALWREEEVGSLENQSITGNATLPPIKCELASITIAVNDEVGLPLPFIDLTLTSKKTGPLPLPKTDNTGIAATNAFTNISYRIEARRYGHLFFNQSIGNLNVTRWINITCPTYTLFVYVLDSNGLPLQNVQVVVYEWSSERVTGTRITNASGSITLGATFGRYKIRVYDSEYTIVLNETVVDLVQDQIFVIHCKISNLDLSVVVIDYFGQPIPNAMVKLERKFEQEYVNIANLTTESDGTASLPKIGGNYRISVYVRNKLFGVKTLYLDESKVIEFKIDKLIVVGGYPLEITQFITYILLGIVVAFFALALAYRKFYPRRVQKEEKSL
ncbi:MAG: hypothetical protein ACE5J6_01065 [Candidatus Bathyarchaeia archaeon]